MPVVTAYIGSTRVTFLVVKSENEFFVDQFPFVYSQSLFGNFIDEKAFYQEIFNFVFSKYELSPGTFELAVCNYMHPLPLDLGEKVNVSPRFLSREKFEGYVVLVGGSYLYLLDSTLEPSLANFLANLSLCPQMVPQGEQTSLFIDAQVTRSAAVFGASGSRIVISGERMLPEYRDLCSNYLLALDLVNNVGFFDVTVDFDNALIPLFLLGVCKRSLYKVVAKKLPFDALGTVFRTEGPTECLFYTDVGTSQFFEVPENQLFFIPLGKGSKAKVLVRNATFGQEERVISGGTLGFVIDTRLREDKSSINYASWKLRIKEILEDL